MEELLAGLRAGAENTRLRILFALSHGEFNVSELTHILGQSQPRVSRHLKLMADAGLIARHKEGNWVLFRLREEAMGGALAHAIVGLLPARDEQLVRDLARLDEIRQQRSEAATQYFKNNAARWEELRSLHVREEDVERLMREMAGPTPINLHIDLGTGTGSLIRTFAGLARHAIGIDQSRDMLNVARANLERDDLRHAQIRHADLYALPFGDSSCDFITVHQVLHYLDDPAKALMEAARVLQPGGRMMVVDFAPHELEQLRTDHAHRRLGISAEHMLAWLQKSGLRLVRHEVLLPPWRKEQTGLTVSVWLAEKPLAATATTFHPERTTS